MRSASAIPKKPQRREPPMPSKSDALRGGHAGAPPMAADGDMHMGAREDQVGRTMPPKPDDDEPKQG